MEKIFTSKKKLGFGLMRLPKLDPDKEDSIDIEQTKKMVDLFMSKGFNYFDTAWGYHNGESERVVGRALKDGYRGKTYLATKLPAWMAKERSTPSNEVDISSSCSRRLM